MANNKVEKIQASMIPAGMYSEYSSLRRCPIHPSRLVLWRAVYDQGTRTYDKFIDGDGLVHQSVSPKQMCLDLHYASQFGRTPYQPAVSAVLGTGR